MLIYASRGEAALEFYPGENSTDTKDLDLQELHGPKTGIQNLLSGRKPQTRLKNILQGSLYDRYLHFTV